MLRDDTENPIRGNYWWDWKNNKDYVYDGEKWVEMSQINQPEAINSFGYKDVYSQGSHVYVWSVSINGVMFTGAEEKVSKAYRAARKEVKRYRKMEKFLNPVAK